MKEIHPSGTPVLTHVWRRFTLPDHLWSACCVNRIAQFSRILRFSIIYYLIFRITFNAPDFHYIIQTIGHVPIPKRHSFSSPLCLFCACGSSVLQNFNIFTHLLTEVEFESCVECNYFNDRARKVRKKFPEGCKIKSGIVFRYCKTNIFSYYSIIFLTLLSSLYRYYRHQMMLLSSFICFTIVLAVFSTSIFCPYKQYAR